MSDRLTDDEIAELRHLHAIATDRALGAFTRSNALEKMTNMLTWRSSSLLSLLDEIEERRRAERSVATVFDEAAEQMTAEQWAKFQALMPKRKDGGA